MDQIRDRLSIVVMRGRKWPATDGDESGVVWLCWNDLVWLIERHADPVEDVRAMNAGLEKLAAAAAG